MQWVTREHPKIDRLACPWLILRFIDPQAEILYVPADTVLLTAEQTGAIPFDVPNVELSHYGRECTFDYLLKKYALRDPALHAMAPIIRGADTDNHALAQQAAGLWAISAGLAYNIRDDQQLLQQGLVLYDALYSWAKHLQGQPHTQQPEEQLLVQVYETYLQRTQNRSAPPPAWAVQLRELIQDHLDTNLSLRLTEVADTLQVNPSYLSREFARYFDDLSFGEYIRKLRIEKALQLLDTTTYSLAEIAYLTGFSDQSHFTRIFKQHTGQSPASYRKKQLRK
ncbi:chromate resistance protein ChrB domain-containing protein [Hymenobacter sp. GOD-10R]|uniref:chromate resistance protein ChrB domain-containing protein n=1 Tax=Hymenobacter sp. GOD-10R TaxID=3093922 RepID=UPI002D791B92|nr:chromate resistance protein ChrB domain-containing protein [Hymenobacter sp. GOD-10R]WRQ27052.1 chromate resistance protein ChrB domain-containing protein [Hymenobacter sp. GOD-10R]